MNFACTHFYPEESCEYTSIFPYMHIYIYMVHAITSGSFSIIFRM